MAQINDIKEYKKIKSKKKRRKNIITGLVAILLIVFVFIVIKAVSTNNFSSKIAQGNFPISFSGYQATALKSVENDLLLSASGQIILYNQSGEKELEYYHGYSNAIVKVSEEKILTYSQGGNKFMINTKENNKKEMKTADDIIFCEVYENGYVAVATLDNSYKAVMTVYDDELKEIYKYYLNEYPVGLAFTSYKTAVIMTQKVESGRYKTTVYGLDFGKSEETFTYEIADILGISIEIKDDRNISIMSLDNVITLNKKGEQITKYALDGDIICTDSSKEYTVIAMKSPTKINESVVVVLDKAGKELKKTTLKYNVDDVICDGMGIAILSDTEVTTYNYKMEKFSSYKTSDYYNQTIRINGNIYALNSSGLDIIK